MSGKIKLEVGDIQWLGHGFSKSEAKNFELPPGTDWMRIEDSPQNRAAGVARGAWNYMVVPMGFDVKKTGMKHDSLHTGNKDAISMWLKYNPTLGGAVIKPGGGAAAPAAQPAVAAPAAVARLTATNLHARYNGTLTAKMVNAMLARAGGNTAKAEEELKRRAATFSKLGQGGRRGKKRVTRKRMASRKQTRRRRV